MRRNEAVYQRGAVFLLAGQNKAECTKVEILEFNLAGPVLTVRPYVHNDHYWQVYFDTNRVIRETFGQANFPVPEQHLALRNT